MEDLIRIALYILLILLVTVSFIFIKPSSSISDCHTFQQEYCPDLFGWEAYYCLKDEKIFDYDCRNMLKIHQSCEKEIKLHCSNKVFSSETEKCLQNVETLSKKCDTLIHPNWKKNEKLSSYQQRRKDEMKR